MANAATILTLIREAVDARKSEGARTSSRTRREVARGHRYPENCYGQRAVTRSPGTMPGRSPLG